MRVDLIATYKCLKWFVKVDEEFVFLLAGMPGTVVVAKDSAIQDTVAKKSLHQREVDLWNVLPQTIMESLLLMHSTWRSLEYLILRQSGDVGLVQESAVEVKDWP